MAEQNRKSSASSSKDGTTLALLSSAPQMITIIAASFQRVWQLLINSSTSEPRIKRTKITSGAQESVFKGVFDEISAKLSKSFTRIRNVPNASQYRVLQDDALLFMNKARAISVVARYSNKPSER
ncbi:MAG TPA: hypothetical protein VN826_11470 [Candidatus Eisenbacteria bacterium]|jgi:hypothetical protein|nr:hypothetical protein [Candidatus Eisenbacteria bacterium]